MLSTSHAFVYLHVPKTAGNAIQRALLPFSDDHITLRAGQDGVDRFGIAGPVTPAKHAPLQAYEARAPGVLRGMAVVISVRHPFERAVSAFFHTQGAEAAFSEETFWAVLNKPVFGPMVAFLRRADGTLCPPQHVIRHERLEADFTALVRALDLPGETRLARVNVSAASADQQRAVLGSRALRDAVEAHYADDMAYFGYDSYQKARPWP